MIRRTSLNYDLLALDLDGTLLGTDGKVSKASAQAVQDARDAGIDVVICTGRALIESTSAIAAIRADRPAAGRAIAPMVCAGGAMLCDVASGRTIHRWAMQSGLVERLCGRQTEDQAVVCQRLLLAADELLEAGSYDYVVINDDLDRAVSEIEAILEAESHRPKRLTNLDDFISKVQREILDYADRNLAPQAPPTR